MQNKTNEMIWNDVVNTAEDLAASIDASIKELAKLKILKDQRKVVFDEYNRLKGEFRRKYYKGNKRGLLCHHKIAACYCNALINKKIVAFNIDDKMTGEMISKICYINYQLAFYVGLEIVSNFLCDYFIENNNMEDSEKDFGVNFVLNQGLCYPVASDTHDDFVEGVIKMLGIQDLQDDKFDILGFSYIYFFIEEHNKMIIKQKYLEQAFFAHMENI